MRQIRSVRPTGSMAGPYMLLAGTFGISLLLSGCSEHDDAAKPPGHQPDFVSTGAKVPNPCKAIDGALVDELIGTDQGKIKKNIDPSQAISSEECFWDNSGLKDETRKQGTLEVSVTVELKHARNAPLYSASKAAYSGLIANKSCKSIALEGSDACWYPGPLPSFSVVVRKGYVTVWVASAPEGSPAASEKRVTAMAKRIVQSVAKNVG